MKSKRVILDTNLWISFLISKKLSEIDEYINNQNVILIFSNELIEEFVNVVSRPKFKSYFTSLETLKTSLYPYNWLYFNKIYLIGKNG